MKPPALVAAFLCLLLLVLGCRQPKNVSPEPEETGPVWFKDATEELGIDFTHDAGPVDEEYFMPQIVGSGVAVFDADGDGKLDLYFLHNGGPKGKKNRLYQQQPDGKFKDVSAGSGLDVAGYGMGVAVGDINNDGAADLAVSEFGRQRLFLNDGKGKFRDITREAGIEGAGWGTSLSFIDFDRDGWLDLFVTHYVELDPRWPCINANGLRDYCAPKTFPGTVSKLYRNLGEGRFKDVTLDAGIAQKTGPGLGVVCADFNGDGWPDIFVANDGAPNHLWINQQNGKFAEEGVRRGVAFNAMGRSEANMGIGWGDVDGDGLQDVFVTHLNTETNTVWRQMSPGQFTDWTASSALHRPRWRGTGFGTVLADFDRDGALDAAIVNGGVTRLPVPSGSPLGAFWGRYGQRNQVFANEGKGTFRDLSPDNPALCGQENVGRGLAIGDLSNDGSLWLVSTAIAGRARLYRNVAPSPGNWLSIRVVTADGKRDALGASVQVRAGSRQWVRTAHTGGSYLCSNDPRVHIGVGRITQIDRIEVQWPDGGRETFAGGPVNRFLTLRRGTGR